MERARRERVGKGVRGVVQFRVGITLDFRGDVARLPFPSPHRSASSFSFLRVLRFAVSMCGAYTPLPSSPDTEKEQQPPGLSARDRSFRAPYLLYIVSTTNTTHSHTTHRYIDTLAYECFSRLATRSSHGKTLCTGHYITVNISEVSPPPPESRVRPG